jgi:predicted hotdog family 3-hydroxylacyl-ACP dehydratase
VDIIDLLPQRAPMVMIDRLVSCEKQAAVGTLKIRDDNVFLHDGKLIESGMIEAMAQTAAARTGWSIYSKPGNEEKNIPVGVIGSIKDFHLYFYPEIDQKIEMKIEVKHEFMNASVIQGSVNVQNKLACEVEMKIFLTEGKSN